MTTTSDNPKSTFGAKGALVLFDGCIAFFLAFSIAAETLMNYTGDIRSLYPDNFIGVPDVTTFALFAVLFVGFFALMRFLRKRFVPAAHERLQQGPEGNVWSYIRTHRVAFFIAWIHLVLAWTLLLLQFWPGTSMNDQLSIIAQPIVSGGTHPLLYNLVLALFVRASLAVCGTGNPGFAAFIILQIVLCAAIVSFCCQWLRYRGVRRVVVVVIVAFFALFPIVAMFSVNAWKDTLFSYVMMLWVPFIFEACLHPQTFWENRKNYLLLAILVIATAFLRNNGLMLALAASLILLIAYRKYAQMRLGAFALAGALVICLLPSAALSLVGVHQITREVVNIPLQQLSAVQDTDNDALSPEAKAYLDELLPPQKVAGSYMPLFADGIKFMGWFDPDYKLDQTRPQFAQAYVEAAMAYPDVFLRAYLSHTYGNWSLIAFTPEQSYELALSANIPGGDFARLMEEYGLHNESFYPQHVQSWFTQTYSQLLVFLGPGACFALILLLGFGLTLKHRRAWPLLVVLPLVLLWGTLMLATPLSLALRYVFPMVCAIPILAGALFAPRTEM